MPSSQCIEFAASPTSITAPVTKFGGHPVWLEEPVIPLSRRTGEPMVFIGQVVIPPELAADDQLCIAYIFMTGAGFDERAMETWSPADGETRVVVQRAKAETAAVAPYPKRLMRWEEGDEDGGRRREVPCEYVVTQTTEEEAAYLSFDQLDELPEADRGRIMESWRGNKIGGAPYWLQAEEFPFGEGSKLLLQLECGTYPFNLNLGTGVGYVFIDASASQAAILWQC